jgi:hypothetical protein
MWCCFTHILGVKIEVTETLVHFTSSIYGLGTTFYLMVHVSVLAGDGLFSSYTAYF